MKRFGCAVLLLFCLVTPNRSGELREAFVASLRERRLDGLLEAYCRNELSDASSGPQSAGLAVELSRSLVTRAAETPDAEARRENWLAARNVLADAIAQTDDPVVEAELLLQMATAAYAEGDWLRQWDELHGLVEEAPSAVPLFLRAIQILEELRGSLATRVAGSSDRTSAAREKRDHLERLLQVVSFRLGSAQVAYGLSLPNRDPKRIEVFESAVRTLEGLAKDANDPELAGLATLSMSEALRGLGRWDEARTRLARLDDLKISSRTAERALAERVEVLLGEDRTLEGLELLHNARSKRTDPPPDWEYLYLKILLRQAKAMQGDDSAVGKLQASALRQLRRLESLSDAVWLRRGEVLLSRHAQYLLLRDTEEYRQAGEILSRSGDYGQAAELFRRAANQALDRGEEGDGISLLQESARLWEKAGAFDRARDSYSEIAERWPERAAAAEALLRAALNARSAYLEESTAANYAAIAKLTDMHLSRYGSTESAGEIRYLRGSMRKAERKYEEAIREFRSIEAGHRLYVAGQLAAARTYEVWKSPLSASATPDDTLGQVVTFLESLVAPFPNGRPELSASERAETLVRLGKFLLDGRIDRVDEAEARLAEVLADPSSPHLIRRDARRYSILANVRLGRYARAEQLATEHADSPAEEILATVGLLQDQADLISELERSYIGRVQTKVVATTSGPARGATAEQKLSWELALARIELNVGNPERLGETIGRLEMLRTEHPRDARILELLGHCFARQRRFDSSVEIWRELIRGLPAGSAGWYRAKLNLIDNLRRMGKRSDARDVLDLLETLHPDLGGPQLRERFLQERERLDS